MTTEIIAITCKNCGKAPSMKSGGRRSVKCEYCDAWNLIKITMPPGDTGGLNSEAWTLFRAGNISEAKARWIQAAKPGSEDGEAYLGLCWCEYAEKTERLQEFIQNIRQQILAASPISFINDDINKIKSNYLGLDNIINDIKKNKLKNRQIKEKIRQAGEQVRNANAQVNDRAALAKTVAKAMIMKYAFDRNGMNYILAKEYAPDADFENFNEQISGLDETILEASVDIESIVDDILKNITGILEGAGLSAVHEIQKAKASAAKKWWILKGVKFAVLSACFSFAYYLVSVWFGLDFAELRGIVIPAVPAAALIFTFMKSGKKK